MQSLLGSLFKTVSSEHFLRLVPAGSVVLDCGTGSGDLAMTFHDNGYDVEAYDRDGPRMQPLRDFGIVTHVGDVLALPFTADTYDYVVCRSLLPHVELWQDALREMLRVSRKGVVFHHNTAEFLPLLRDKGASRFVASRAELEALGVRTVIPLAALIVPGRTAEIEAALSDSGRYAAALAYERTVLPFLPLECGSKLIGVLEKQAIPGQLKTSP